MVSVEQDDCDEQETTTLQQLDPHEPVLRRSVYRRESFLVTFATSKGPPQIVILIMLLALGFGSTIGVVPAVMTDRYARLNHGYADDRDCSDYTMSDKPLECLNGSSDAQNAAALASLISNGLTFITSSLVGSISDERGRKGVLGLGLLLATFHPLCLVLLQTRSEMSPFWYYASGSLSGLVNWIAVALSALSDVMPAKWRAASFGMLLAGFSLGFAFAPILALAFDHFQVSVFSLILISSGLVVTIFFFPETLSEAAAAEATQARATQRRHHHSLGGKIIHTILRPLRELSILNRSRLFRLLSALAFFSGMVTSGDQTLLIYYVEERLAFDDHDVAMMFLMIGILGILVQGVLIKPFNDCLGERLLVAVAFLLGAVDNLMYGLATNKTTIFVAVAISSFTGMSFPTISAIKANNVDASEQGRIQGALYSLQALASGVGPMALRTVYRYTKDKPYPGAGSMFIFASFLFLLASVCACALPKDQANSRKSKEEEHVPILDEDESSFESSYGTALL